MLRRSFFGRERDAGTVDGRLNNEILIVKNLGNP
jgi:hypothetical protein